MLCSLLETDEAFEANQEAFVKWPIKQTTRPVLTQGRKTSVKRSGHRIFLAESDPRL